MSILQTCKQTKGTTMKKTLILISFLFSINANAEYADQKALCDETGSEYPLIIAQIDKDNGIVKLQYATGIDKEGNPLVADEEELSNITLLSRITNC